MKPVLLILFVWSVSINSLAQRNTTPSERESISRLERTINRLQQRVAQMDSRLSNIENYLDNNGSAPPKKIIHACMVVDSNTKRVFFETANTKIDAEFKSKELCGKSVYRGDCTGQDSQHLKCDSNIYIRGSSVVCIMSDGNTKRVFRGTGETAVLAEANAKTACQKSVYSGYCGLQPVQCEEAY